MPKHYNEKTIKQADEEGVFSNDKRIPFDIDTTQSFNAQYLVQRKTQERMAKSLRKSDKNLSERESMLLADEKLAARRKGIRETDVTIGRTPGATAEFHPELPGVRERGRITLSPKSVQTDPRMKLTHEFDHAALSKAGLTESDIDVFERNQPNTQTKDTGDITDPLEMHSRLQTTREKAKELGIYDPFTEDFSSEHYDKLTDYYGGEFGTPGTNEGDNVQQFLRNTNKESAIEILNTVAQAQPVKKPWGFA